MDTILSQIQMIAPVNCSFLTHRGHIRPGNEDSILVAGTVIAGVSMDHPERMEISGYPVLVCVADGVGGAVHGELASRTVLDYLSRSQIPETEEGVVSLMCDAKGVLDQMVSHDPSLSGFGTTAAGMVLSQTQAIIFNCGDSRVYRLDNGRIDRVSHDHSLVQELCDQGLITSDQVYTHPYRNIITAVISGDLHRPAPPVMTAVVPITGNERFLLCTDGLWEVIRDPDLAGICSAGDLHQAAAGLLATALDRGGPDNISLILIGR